MIAIDTNILVHAHRRDASFHPEAKVLIRDLAESSTPWNVTYHSLVEFYGVVTRTKLWNQASTPIEASNQIEAWRSAPSLRILYDTRHCLDQLTNLVQEAKVTGALVHDARIAACCLSNGVNELWTVDRDFSRFSRLKTRNPLSRI